MPRSVSFLFLLFAGALLVTCEKPRPPKQLSPAFYHWKAVYQPKPTEHEVLRRLGVQRLYIRFFDVDWNTSRQQPMPVSVIHFADRPTGLAVVPVVFITNRTILNLPASAVPQLAKNITKKITQITQQNHIRINEVQLDCDWSPRSRDRYFTLLRAMKGQLQVPISASIRLHQIKYADQTGVPPVDRGMLMVYNMADWKDPKTRNSILDLDVASRYTGFLEKYPLPLDVVLPLFSWTLVYRNGRFLTIVNGIRQSQLVNRSFLQPQADTNRFVATRDTSAFGISVREGDLFRAEACRPEDLTQASRQLLDRLSNQTLTFALYHLDSTVLAPYSHDYLQTLFRTAP
ncbi:hypothetical protein ACFSUS_23160 [Spirosoma soli]|uniref:Lipoprotein n=1 Tax=Spirosoma soli TaxID=1770529 RepID=A0ABW5M943_9BACT